MQSKSRQLSFHSDNESDKEELDQNVPALIISPVSQQSKGICLTSPRTQEVFEYRAASTQQLLIQIQPSSQSNSSIPNSKSNGHLLKSKKKKKQGSNRTHKQALSQYDLDDNSVEEDEEDPTDRILDQCWNAMNSSNASDSKSTRTMQKIACHTHCGEQAEKGNQFYELSFNNSTHFLNNIGTFPADEMRFPMETISSQRGSVDGGEAATEHDITTTGRAKPYFGHN